VSRTGDGVFSVRGAGRRAAGQGIDRTDAGTTQDSVTADPAPAATPAPPETASAAATAGPGEGDRPSSHRSGRGGGDPRRTRIILLAVAAVGVVIVAVSYVLLHAAGAQPRAPRTGGGRGAGRTISALQVRSVTPAAGARHIDGSAPITVAFSAPLASGSPEPVIRPAVAGTWSNLGDDAIFTPARPFRPGSRVTVRVPAGAGGVRMAGGEPLAAARTVRFSIRGYNQLRLAQLLSQLGYLPVTWTPAQGVAARTAGEDGGHAAVSQAALAYDPPAGRWTWQAGYPRLLSGLWRPVAGNVVLRGAVMAFESQHGMTIDGTVDARLWSAVFRAAQRGRRNTNGYTYALASKNLPESLTIWHDGRIAMRTLANTGIPVAPTADGTFPVYERLPFQIMRGTNPDGSTYADPVSFVSYFNGGEAVHYFPRGSYGWQQSLGCVELPYPAAEQAYPFLTYGSLVTVAP
jgi:peptidoglycan hydrolase-like protein with peptidoglycan-binding domain